MGSLGSSLDEKRRILFIDAFDSFTNNIIGLLEQCLDVDVTMVHINDEYVNENFTKVLRSFDAVVVGPGPGHPAVASDVGFINKLWALGEEDMLPVLGVCLGFQSLCINHGGQVKKLRQARHGIVARPIHNDTDIFCGIRDLDATQYHSLHVDIGNLTGEDVCWEPTKQCPSLLPLAWDVTDELNGPLLMGVRHASKPFWGVQFHPESICTSDAGKEIITSWWTQARDWLERTGRRAEGTYGRTRVNGHLSNGDKYSNGQVGSHLAQELRSIAGNEDVSFRWRRHSAANIVPTDLVEGLGLSRDEVVLLDSQGHKRGRYSILGLVVPGKTMKVTYRVADRILRYGVEAAQTSTTQLDSIDDVWPILQEALDLHDPRKQGPSSRASGSGPEMLRTDVEGHFPEDIPFWGGFMGYISYEAGLETIDVEPHKSCATGGVPDINFAFIHRSVVIDHEKQQVYIQSLLPGDGAWVLDVGRVVDGLVSQAALSGEKGTTTAADDLALTKMLDGVQVERPQEAPYREKVLQCQDFLAAGDSYELCLTDETEIKVPTANNLDSWLLYKRLRKHNPAPFGAYVRLSDVTVVGSSPERFLRWTRDGRCQFRPIKGTVKKGPDMTRERAHEILDSSKERAENLMIVDLIRHDLCGVVGADKSWVSKLMVVEEYETVYQLVSVIEGQLPTETDGPRGMHVLKASLPPGSMTGAPKKRSCEILRELEARPRGLYSGVLGYMEVGGAGDFSVVIRTAVRNSNKDPVAKADDIETWRVGAGGAVTIQSTDEGEFIEMETKASSVLGAILPKK